MSGFVLEKLVPEGRGMRKDCMCQMMTVKRTCSKVCLTDETDISATEKLQLACCPGV